MGYQHGIENLSSIHNFLQGKRLGLITNPSGLDQNFRSVIDVLNEQYRLVRMFAPEHGVRGDRQAGEAVTGYMDENTGIPVESLFDASAGGKLNTRDLDCVLYDIQDVGVRFFSYTYTMATAMKSCADAKIPFVVLDRYNPLGLEKVEGCLMDSRFDSGVGGYGLPTRHGMTIGELARYINGEYSIGCNLTVVKCEGLARNMDYRHCNVPWVLPSPNCATYETVLCYAGTALFEGTNVSEGRGTVRPFELIGAPWMQNEAVVAEMEKKNLPGVRFRTTCFRPTFSKYQGQLCKGLQLHITDPDSFQPVRCGWLLLDVIRRMHQKFAFDYDGKRYFIDLLMGTDLLRSEAFDLGKFCALQEDPLKQFVRKAGQYFLY